MDAIHLVDGAGVVVGCEALATARCLLRGLDAMSAKDALIAIGAVAKSCDVKDPNRGYVKAADKAARDVVVSCLVNRGGTVVAICSWMPRREPTARLATASSARCPYCIPRSSGEFAGTSGFRAIVSERQQEEGVPSCWAINIAFGAARPLCLF